MRPFRSRPGIARRQPSSLRRGSWISLFAVLMIFIGPLISQSMPMDHRASMSERTGMSTDMNMPMSMDMSTDAHAAHAKAAAPEHCPPVAEHHALWEKCGYCSLLYNCPALTGAQPFVAFDTPLASPFNAPLPRLAPARHRYFPGARPRAPPAAA